MTQTRSVAGDDLKRGGVVAARLVAAAPVILFALLLATFGSISPQFFTAQNFTNILVQATSNAMVATGMTFVLLTGGVDLSVGRSRSSRRLSRESSSSGAFHQGQSSVRSLP